MAKVNITQFRSLFKDLDLQISVANTHASELSEKLEGIHETCQELISMAVRLGYQLH